MLVKGKILLAALLAGAASAASIKEIPEVDVEQLGSRDLQSRYGVQPNYPGAQPYNDAKKYTPQPTPKPSSYTPPTPAYSSGGRTVYTDESGRQYVLRKRNGVETKVYTDTPGWNEGGRTNRRPPSFTPPSRTFYTDESGRQYVLRKRNGVEFKVYTDTPGWNDGGRGGARPERQKTDAWSSPTPPKDAWSPPTPKPDGWNAGYPTIPTYQGYYNPAYSKTHRPTMVPTWDSDGHGRDYGKCVEPFKSACCIQKDYYSFDQKQSLCKKLGCDYLECDKDEPNWDTDGHQPTAMPTWGTDAWEDDTWNGKDECTGAAREACCTQTKGDELTKSKMCERLKCDWNKCQKEPGWGGDTHPPTNRPTTKPTPAPTSSGWDGDANDNDDWAGDGQCTKDEQDRCCSQHESKSLELQAKICQNKFGCSIFKCPQNRKGGDGWYGDAFDGLDWSDDGHLDDTCTADEQDKCCEQHDGISITQQQQICKNMWNCSLLKCAKHRQSNYPVKDDGSYEDACSATDKLSCCDQNPLKPFGSQYGFCSKLGCDIYMCDKYIDGAWKNDAWYEEDAEKCTEEEHYNCCTQPDTIGVGVQHENCLKAGCSLFKCDEDEDYETYRNKDKWEDAKVQFGYGGDDSTCPDSNKWQCCSPNRSISGSYKSIVKNCQDIGCDWDMCPQNRDPELQDNQNYYDSYYEYGNGDDDDTCTDAGKWSCCNPDSTLTGLKAWVKNCEEHSCEWQKCPHHRQGFYDPLEPTVNKDNYGNDEEPDETAKVETVEELCTDKEQYKCCNQKTTLKEATKNCESSGCDIAVCNNISKPTPQPTPQPSGYSDGNYKTGTNYGGYGGGGDDYKPQGNKGPKLYSGTNATADYGSGGSSKSSSSGFMDQGVKEDCKKEFTSGGACREVCTAKVEYKIMGIVMSTHDETTTKPCS